MSEITTEESHLEDRERNEIHGGLSLDLKAGPKEDPMARTNLSLDGLNPDFRLTDKARERIAALPDADKIQTAEEATPSPEQAEELARPEVLTTRAGQEITVLKVNWPKHKEGEPVPSEVTVVLPAFLADPNDGPAHETVKQLAIQMPDRPVLAVSQPKSSREQGKALSKHKDLGPTAAAILEVMQSQGITDINLVARSMGAWTASTMAAHAHDFGIKVHEAVLIESANAGVSTGDIAKGFGKEIIKGYPDMYHANPSDPEMKEAARLDKSPLVKMRWDIANLVRPLFTGRARDALYRFPKGMGAGSLESDLAEAIIHQPGMRVTLVNGGVDPISTNVANEAVEQHLNERFNPDTDPKNNPVSRIIGPGEAHSHLENAKATANLVRQRLSL